MKTFGSEKFWFITANVSIIFIVVYCIPDEKDGIFSNRPKTIKVQKHYTVFICNLNIVSVKVQKRYYFHLQPQYSTCKGAKTLYVIFVCSFNVVPIQRISLKPSKFLLKLIEYKVSLMYNSISFVNTIVVLPRPSIRSVGPITILTFTFIDARLVKYFLSWRIAVCNYTICQTYIFTTLETSN